MRCSRYGNGGPLHVILNDESLEEVGCFKYLVWNVSANGGCEIDVVHRISEGYRACGALRSVKVAMGNRGMTVEAARQ